MNLIDNLQEVFELATSLTSLANEILKLKIDKNKIKVIANSGDYAQIANSGDSAKIGSSGYYAKIDSSGDSAQIGSSGDSAKIANSGYSAQIGSSGDYAQIANSGDSAKIGSSGYYAQIANSGYSAKIGSSGDYAQIANSGDSAKIGSSGYYAKIDSSGDSAQIGSSGDSAKIANSGYSAQIGSSGDYAQIANSGYYAQIGSSGDYAQIANSGYSAQIGSSGDYAQIANSGYYAQIDVTGLNSIACGIGKNTIIKGKIGTWITLAEYDNKNNPVCVKSAQIDEKILKENTYYTLYNGDFHECIIIDGIISILINQIKNVSKIKTLQDKKIAYIFTKNGVSAHGNTVRQAYLDWLFKTSDRDVSQYTGLQLNDIKPLDYWVIAYRTITGACSFGTNEYLENNKDKYKAQMTLQEVFTATEGQYGSQTFKEFFERI